MTNLQKMVAAGLTMPEIDICEQRFKESGMDNYGAWVVGYIVMNGKREVDINGMVVKRKRVLKTGKK